jgi:hypothetical protein
MAYLLIHTVVHGVVSYFKQKILCRFHLLLRNLCINTFTGVFEVNNDLQAIVYSVFEVNNDLQAIVYSVLDSDYVSLFQRALRVAEDGLLKAVEIISSINSLL